jgi:hypothetical protein
MHQAGIAGAPAEIAGVAGVAAADVDDAAPAAGNLPADAATTTQDAVIFRLLCSAD